jgi:O-antigen/teichoic acid export membrane protein
VQNGDGHPLNQKSLADASLSALKWDYAGTATRAMSSMVISVVLARLLGPEPFGLVAIAWLVVGFGNLVADLGMGPALVQRRTISDYDVRYAFTMQMCMGIGLMAVLALSAPVVAEVFNQPKVVPVVWAMSLVFVLQTFGGIAVSLLKREMDFKRIQSARIGSYLAGFLGLGIPFALLGFEVWSLVIAQLSQTTLFSLLCYAQVRHPIKPLFALPSSGLSHFGVKVLLTNIVNYLISNLDSFFIGHFFDVVILGLYNRASVLVSTPMNNLVVTVQQVLFSAYSRIQNDPQTVRRGYLAGVGFMTMLMLPTYGCVALVPTTVIHGLFGNEWGAAIPFLVPLALTMPFHAVMATGGPMLWAQDKVGREFVAQLFTAFVFLIVLFATSMISVTALVWGVFVASIFRFVLITHASLKTVGASWSTLLRSISGSMVLLISTGGMVFCSDWVLAFLDISASPRLLLDMLVGANVFLGTVLMLPKLIPSPEMCWLAERLRDQLPTWIRPLVKRITPSARVPV